MKEKTNIIQFSAKGEGNNGVSDVLDITAGKVENIQNNSRLKLHESFTYQNVLGALVSNKFINVERHINEQLLKGTNHDFNEMMSILYEYIEASLNIFMDNKGYEVQGGGRDLSSLLLIEKGTNIITFEFFVELFLNEYMETDILVKDPNGGINAMIAGGELALSH